MDRNKINALIALLDDTDAVVVNAVTDNLLKEGISIVPHLEKAWETAVDEKIQERLEQVIHNIQFETTKHNLSEWKGHGAINVLEGACYLAQFQFPEISFDKILFKVEYPISETILSWICLEERDGLFLISSSISCCVY